jgi:hypothetical protein
MDAPDARVRGSSCRYRETQRENDGEGRAINAGHPGTLESDAPFLDRVFLLSREVRRLAVCSDRPVEALFARPGCRLEVSPRRAGGGGGGRA